MDEEKSHGVLPLCGLGLPDDGIPDPALHEHGQRLHIKRHLREANDKRGLAAGPQWE